MSLSKNHLLVVLLAVAVTPWLSGGREPLALLLSYMALGLGIFLLWRSPQLRPLGFNLLTGSALALWLWAALSLVWSVNRFSSAVWLIYLGLAIAAFGLAYQLASSAPAARAWIGLYLGVATVFSLYGLWLYLAGEYPRLTSSFYWANPWAAWSLPAVVLGGWYWAKGAGRRYLLAAAVTLAAFILADSRSAWLVLVLVAVPATVKLRRPARFWRRGLVVVAAAIIVSQGLVSVKTRWFEQPALQPGSRFAEAASGESTSAADRLNYLRAAAAIWRQHPLVGTGAGTFAVVHPQYQIRVISAATNAHNFYAQTASELGLVGLLLVTALAAGLGLGVLRGVRQDRRRLPPAIVLGALVVHLGLDIDSSYPAILLLVAMLAGLVWLPPPGGFQLPTLVGRWGLKPRPTGRQLKAAGYPAWLLAALVIGAYPVAGYYQSHAAAERGRWSQQDGEFALAAKHFNRARQGIVYNPDVVNAEGINYYVLAATGQDKAANLALARQRALLGQKLDPLDAQHTFLLARVLLKTGDVVGAEAAYRQTLKLDPYNHPDYYLDLVRLYQAAGRPDEAFSYADRGAKLYPEAVVANRQSDEAVAPAVSELHLAKAVVLVDRGEVREAKESLRRAVRIYPANAQAAQMLLSLNAQNKPNKQIVQ
ncbi:O-antigen ligase family protein [Candidatus Parcubacteria bacterium]|nr:O-antigen ligase family protein [Candidatus Parcubacteria bacterium]